MKNLLIPFILFLTFVSVNLYSQTFTFERISPEIVYQSQDSIEVVSYAHIVVTSQPDSIRIIRTLNNLPSGWTSSICDIRNCYAPEVNEATAYYPIGTHEISVHFTNVMHTLGFGTVILKAEKVSNPSENYSVTFNASSHPIGIKQISSTVKEFKLNQNYPNPFNPATKIAFSIPTSNYVDLRIYDILGREVSTLVSRQLNAGEYEIEFDAKNLSSGMYYYRLQSGDNVSVKKMTLVK